MYLPSKVFFTTGVGRHSTEIGSFEMALRDASIEPYNIATVSSILPPDAEITDAEEAVDEIPDGSVVHAVLSRCSTDDEDEQIAASVGAARGNEGHGYLIELSNTGEKAENNGEKAKDLAVELLSHKTMAREAFEYTASATGTPDGHTTTVAAAVLIE
ncbi:MAG: pyruvoyl-dependent arginine decarboxylase [Halobacteria archaeon]|nr:pyruvoyl-dependent arginine decarboxylase [Halobacteria archaeon]